MIPWNPHYLAAAFESFGIHETYGSSPLYERLCLGVSKDQELLALAARTRPGQPVPNLFLAAVHYLLLKGSEHELRNHYATIHPNSVKQADPFPAFRDFCLTHADDIVKLLETRLVQTNVVERCSNLLPAFGLFMDSAPQRRLAFLEIGPSAGLNLFWDRYRYDYAGSIHYGNQEAAVRLTSVVRGTVPPPIPDRTPEIAYRAGIDLNPVDLENPDAVLWLKALVWPGHVHRYKNLDAAIAIARESPPLMFEGSVLDLLDDVVREIPADLSLCVFHTHVVNQLSELERNRLSELLEHLARERDFDVVSIEGRKPPRPAALKIATYRDGKRCARELAHCDSHGRWLEWL